MLTPFKILIEALEDSSSITPIKSSQEYKRGLKNAFALATNFAKLGLDAEKEVIEKAFEAGVSSEGKGIETGLDYYNQTFNNGKD